MSEYQSPEFVARILTNELNQQAEIHSNQNEKPDLTVNGELFHLLERSHQLLNAQGFGLITEVVARYSMAYRLLDTLKSNTIPEIQNVFLEPSLYLEEQILYVPQPFGDLIRASFSVHNIFQESIAPVLVNLAKHISAEHRMS